jgi:hypothetical protein
LERAPLLFLGETGVIADSQILEQFLESRLPRMRLPAVRGIANLHPDAYTNSFVLALADSNPRVAREAAIVLTRKANSIGGKRLSEVFEECA